MKVERKNVFQILSVILFLALLIGVIVNKDNLKVTNNAKIEEVNNEVVEEAAVAEVAEIPNGEDTTEVKIGSPKMVERSLSSNEIVEDTGENTNRYVVYTIARVINPKDTSTNQKYRCIINKNETGAETGLVDIIIGENTSPILEDESNKENIIDEYRAEIKVNNAGEWIFAHEYYIIEFSEIIDNEIREVVVTDIGIASEQDIENWKQGRSLNSTFLSDMETIKKSEPAEIYDDICNNYQYTWTFEQIEAFKAYVESLDDENKDKWIEAYTELDITIGY